MVYRPVLGKSPLVLTPFAKLTFDESLETIAKLIVTTGPAGTPRKSSPVSIHVSSP
jgi:hypothetical protein